MGEIPEEDEAAEGGGEPEAEKMISTEEPKKTIPKTGGLVEGRGPTPWDKVAERVVKILNPCRSRPPDDKELPVDNVGCCSYAWIHWMTRPMVRAYKHGLASRDLFTLPTHDQAKFNAERLQRIWDEEQAAAAAAGRKPSFSKCILRFGRTRFVIAGIFLVISVVMQFLAPSLVLKLLLDFVNDPDQNIWWGWALVLILGCLLLIRTVFFSLNFTVSILTSIRVLGASQYLGFSKLLRLSSANDAALGQFLTFCTGDQERIAEAVTAGLLFFGTPVMFLASISYMWILVGPIALLGCAVILLFYPIMGVLAAITSVLRLRVVKVTDKRVTLMNEIIGAMRLIKMYAWEDPFRKRILEVRKQERSELQKAAFLQSISTSITPSITIIAIIVTIVALTATGFPLTAPLAFTLFSIYSALQFTVGTLPYSLKCITEAKVSFDRLQKLLELPEHVRPQAYGKDGSAPNDENLSKDVEAGDNFAVVISNANLAWEAASNDSAEASKKKAKAKKRKDKTKKAENGVKNVKKDDVDGDANVVVDDDAEKEALKADDANYVQCLNNIDLKIKPGEFVGVAGHIGAGKSSLISAIMGEMKLLSGDLKVNGGIAVVPQQAWIFNGTVRDNILFGAEFEPKLYEQVLDACALKTDLEILPDGDQALIGEKGVNLSGGQKQRLSLARALYAHHESAIFLLDDPLSAVDPKVSNEIYSKYIVGFLRKHNKTILLATHGMQFLRQCDNIIFLKNGSILESGTYQQLMESKSEFENLVSYEQVSDKTRRKSETEGDADAKDADAGSGRAKSPVKRLMSVEETNLQKLIPQEENEVYKAGWSVMLRYFKACGGYFVTFLLFFAMFLFAMARLFTAIWLQIWLDKGDGRSAERIRNATLTNVTLSDSEIKGYVTENPDLWFYQLIFGVSLIVMLVFGVIKAVSLAIRLLAGSSKLHDLMLKRILFSPMSFFDVTPAGRIINRFSKDMDELDVRIPFYFEFVTTSIFFCITQIGLVCFVYPLFTIAFIVIVVVFLSMDICMNKGVGMTKRLDNETKSSILHDISSMVPGIPIIRAFERQYVFQQQFDRNVNRNLSAQAMFRFSNRWFSLRMDLIGTLTIVTVAAVVVASKGSVSAAAAGLALANVFQVATFIPFVMMLKAEFKARFNSVERVCQYANDLPQEAASHVLKHTPPKGWPSQGLIKFEQVCLRYRPEMPQVLRGLTFEVLPGEKVGIVGRTGAGKTSLFGALLRLTELDDGKVLIDGVDVGKIGLFDLRSSVAVIPQDPVLFQGTLRYNLDPFNRYDDAALWSALESAHLKEKIVSANGGGGADTSAAGLDMVVATEGDNFSVGEKQLICLARALLRGNKILLLDEATASVDLQTDYLIQTTIREAFAECSVLTIAHRVHTIVNYDKVIVMQRGQIIEQGKPSDLLKDKQGVFASMLAASRAPAESGS